MIRFLLTGLLLSCASDISVITVEKNNDDTAIVAEPEVLNTPTSEPGTLEESSGEPGTQDTGSSTFPEDLVVGYAEMHFKQISCPQCVGAYSEFDIQAKFLLHQPTSGNYFAYMQEPGSCTTQLVETNVGVTPIQSNQPVNFNNITLYPVGPGEWLAQNLYEYQYERNSIHNINTAIGSVQNAFTSIEGFDDIQPYTLLWVDPSYAFDAVISKNGTTFSWYPALTTDQFEIIVAVYSPDGSQLLGAVSCFENDTGYMFIPGQYFQSFPYFSLTAVHLIRHRTGETYAPDFNGVLQWHMLWEVIGTGHVE
jgi:hypothetical protein